MTEQEKANKATVIRFNEEVIAKGNTEALYAIIHPDFINHTAPPGSAQGPQGIIDFTINILHKAITDIEVNIWDQVVQGDKVVTRKTIQGNHAGAFLGIPPSGQRVAINIIDIIILKEGRYREHWSIRDVQDLINKSNN